MKKNRYKYIYNINSIDWEELSKLYNLTPLGKKDTEHLKIVYSNSRYYCFIYHQNKLIGAGRALADGLDYSLICDVAVHPKYQGNGLGKSIVDKLLRDSSNYKKTILYSAPGKEAFYKKLGFSQMKTAMAIFKDNKKAKNIGLIED